MSEVVTKAPPFPMSVEMLNSKFGEIHEIIKKVSDVVNDLSIEVNKKKEQQIDNTTMKWSIGYFFESFLTYIMLLFAISAAFFVEDNIVNDVVESIILWDRVLKLAATLSPVLLGGAIRKGVDKIREHWEVGQRTISLLETELSRSKHKVQKLVEYIKVEHPDFDTSIIFEKDQLLKVVK